MGSVPLVIRPRELKRVLDQTAPGWPLFPEFDQARKDIAVLQDAASARGLGGAIETLLAGLYPIPQTTYTLYRRFRRIGERRSYEHPYFEKRGKLTAATLALFLGQDDLLDALQDYVVDICEETTWVIPAHEGVLIDLFAAETGFQLAETIVLFQDRLEKEVIERVRREIERRIFQNYLAHHDEHWWFQGGNNWNGVCNGSVGSTFLILEQDTRRMAEALSLVLTGLEAFLNTAFESDGGSTEGVGYWHYGLMNVICFSEMLRQRTKGRVDVLSVDKVKAIARYPLQMMLSPGHFASFSDSQEVHRFHPGIVARLAERTGQPEVRRLLVDPGAPAQLARRLPMALRNLLWWDGTYARPVSLGDAILPDAGVVRLVAETAGQMPVVIAFKAGHNGENHNQNDVGTFIVHVGGETFLCDPGRGLYSRQYFGAERYENVFASSYGHSVPVVDGQLQAAGREFEGQIVAFDPDQEPKPVVAEIGGAYAVDGLQSLRRTICLSARGEDGGRVTSTGVVTLTDTFAFDVEPSRLQEAFVTWLDVRTEGNTAVLHGKERDLELTIETPAGAAFAVESLDGACKANAKPGVLKRLTIDLPPRRNVETSVAMRVLPK
jgi:hypothetical protein